MKDKIIQGTGESVEIGSSIYVKEPHPWNYTMEA